jgi:hypothetical protein
MTCTPRGAISMRRVSVMRPNAALLALYNPAPEVNFDHVLIRHLTTRTHKWNRDVAHSRTYV